MCVCKKEKESVTVWDIGGEECMSLYTHAWVLRETAGMIMEALAVLIAQATSLLF